MRAQNPRLARLAAARPLAVFVVLWDCTGSKS
jgi:hypothetical protein